MSQPKISIIIPVYKAEKYIHKCIDSLLKQTFKDYEIILIDDGSPDDSGKICDDYAKADKRIKVIHKINGGVSSARQCGIDNAQGVYTIHVDPDDWVEPTMLEELYHKAIEDNADMVICDFIKYYSPSKQEYIQQQPTRLEYCIVLHELFIKLHGSLWNKLIKKDCYDNFNVKFPTKFNLYEDLYVCTCMLKHPIRISYVGKAFYHYDLSANINSLVKRIDYKTLQEDKFFYDTMLDLLKDSPSVKVLFKRYMSYPIVLRALKAKCLSIEEFSINYKRHKKYILKHPQGNILGKIICYISCCGFYKLIKKVSI